MEREVRAIEVLPDVRYHQIGIRSFGKGTFHKPPVTGADLGKKAIYEIREGDLMFNMVFAWEGAVAVATERDHGLCASHRFPTYRPAAGIADADYLRLFFETAEGRELLDLHSPGTAGRNRTLNRAELLAEPVRLPALESQLGTVSVIRQADEVVVRAAEDLTARRALRRALMDDLIAGGHPLDAALVEGQGA